MRYGTGKCIETGDDSQVVGVQVTHVEYIVPSSMQMLLLRTLLLHSFLLVLGQGHCSRALCHTRLWKQRGGYESGLRLNKALVLDEDQPSVQYCNSDYIEQSLVEQLSIPEYRVLWRSISVLSVAVLVLRAPGPLLHDVVTADHSVAVLGSGAIRAQSHVGNALSARVHAVGH